MNKERLLTVLLAPRITEKVSKLSSGTGAQYCFKVRLDADKREIAEAIKQLLKVEVASVRVCKVKGETKKFGRTEGKRQDWKKAYVTLKEGQVINFGVS